MTRSEKIKRTNALPFKRRQRIKHLKLAHKTKLQGYKKEPKGVIRGEINMRERPIEAENISYNTREILIKANKAISRIERRLRKLLGG